MSLLGWPLLALLAVSAVGYPVLTLTLWPRVRGSRSLRAATRLAMVAGCQVTAVLLVAVAVNHYGYFYGSWSELPGLPDPGWSSRQQWATRGRVESVTIRGVRSGLTSHAFVYLPPQYFQAEFAHRALPVTQVLAGVPGSDLG